MGGGSNEIPVGECQMGDIGIKRIKQEGIKHWQNAMQCCFYSFYFIFMPTSL